MIINAFCAQMEEGTWLHALVVTIQLIVGFVIPVFLTLICYLIIQDVLLLNVKMIMELTKMLQKIIRLANFVMRQFLIARRAKTK